MSDFEKRLREEYAKQPVETENIPAALTDAKALSGVRYPYGWNETRTQAGPES